MKHLFRISSLLFIFLFSSIVVNGQDKQVPAGDKWAKIAPFFSPPEQYQNDFGKFWSPLRFYNGKEVKTAADWKKRRKEIRDKWTDMMGEWPALIKNQKNGGSGDSSKRRLYATTRAF